MWEHMLCSFPQDGIWIQRWHRAVTGHCMCATQLSSRAWVADSCAQAGSLMQRHLDDALPLFIRVSTVDEPGKLWLCSLRE